jgi:Flp pilus assembly protein TadD
MGRLPDRARPFPALVALALLACASGGGVEHARVSLARGDLERARAELERERAQRPDSFEVRIGLGEVYYRIARDALDRERDEARYLAFLERSIDEFVRAVELDPFNPQPHFYLGMMDVYRGDLDAALRGLQNTRRLNPTGVAYTNIAETFVYRGDLQMAQRWNRRGWRRGAGVGPVRFNDMLIQWSAGDMRAARRSFQALRARNPEMIRTINTASLPAEPGSFDEFAGYCCLSPACGPYLEHACDALGLQVQRRVISEESVLRELRLEMEKQRRLREVYEGRKELELEIEDPELPDSPR